MKKLEIKQSTTINGDCLEVLRSMPDNSMDSLVTDPPAGISFMGKSWDGDKGGRTEWIAWMAEVMRECLRVMKPGAHGLVWSLPRTSHWTATACEDAGLEVRDKLFHIFGSGFPKSLDVSKAIDKAAGAEREVVGRTKTPYKLSGVNGNTGAMSDVGRKSIDENGYRYTEHTAPATDDAKTWQGWGTALKPACEEWILVRKPLSEKTVAKNVLKWGTGALNIDASRVDPVGFTSGGSCKGNSALHMNKAAGVTEDRKRSEQHAQGRFPSHLLLSHSALCTDDTCAVDCAVAQLDAQSGTLKFSYATNEGKASSIYGGKLKSERNVINKNRQGDSGGASRFFYCAKISSSERNAAGPNNHPTIKSQKLMRYLCRMVTPPGGVVLDPFMGSGSTGLAALSEGFKFVGIEREPEYVAIAEKRIETAPA